MLTRGTLARLCHVNIETVRYYERNGLLPVASRSKGNYRLFDESCVERVMFIKQAQGVGFSLSDIRQLLRVRFDAELINSETDDLIRQKIGQIDQQVAVLHTLRLALVTASSSEDIVAE